MTTLTFRRAVTADLPAIVVLLADDEFGRTREAPGPPLDPRYVAAFAAIDGDANQLLAVADDAGAVVACMQITFIPGLGRVGRWRGLVEAVRVASGRRGGGIGRQMMVWAIGECRRRGCGLVQLTTDKRRPDAHRFYERLGFVASHEGMKLEL